MFCYKVRKLIIPFIDNALIPDQANRISEHLSACRFCRREYESLKAVSRALRSQPIPPADPDPALWTKIAAGMESSKQYKAPEYRKRFSWAAASAAMVSVLVLAISAALVLPVIRSSKTIVSRNTELKTTLPAASPKEQPRAMKSLPNKDEPGYAKPALSDTQKQRSVGNDGIALKPAQPPSKKVLARSEAYGLHKTGKTAPALMAKAVPASKPAAAPDPVSEHTVKPNGADFDESTSHPETAELCAGTRNSTTVTSASQAAVSRDIELPANRLRAVGTTVAAISESKEETTSVDVINKNDRHEKRKALFSYP